MAAGDLFTPSAPLTPAQIAERNRRRIQAQTAVEEQRRTEQLRTQAAAREPQPSPVNGASLMRDVAGTMAGAFPGAMMGLGAVMDPKLQQRGADMLAGRERTPYGDEYSPAGKFARDLILSPAAVAGAAGRLNNWASGKIWEGMNQVGDLFTPQGELNARKPPAIIPQAAAATPPGPFSGQAPYSQQGQQPQAGQMMQPGSKPQTGTSNYYKNVGFFESNGNPSARNPTTGAYGYYQFTPDTWVRTYKQMNPNTGMSRQAILHQMQNPEMQDRAMTFLTHSNQAYLKGAGIDASDGNTYAAHWLGGPTAAKVLKGDSNQLVSDLVSSKVIEANPILAGKTVQQFRALTESIANGTYERGGKTASGQPGSNWSGGGGGEGTGTFFNPAYDQQALQMIQSATEQAAKPSTFFEQYDPGPEVPQMQAAPHTDWTKADAALADMRPEELDDKLQQRLVQSNLWKGAAQALASLPEGAGLGKVLAAFGGGMMSGAVTGNEAFDKKLEDYQTKVAAYKGAIFRNEMDKAKTLQDEMANDVEVLNKNAWNNYVREKDNFARTHEFQLNADGSANISRLSPDGKTLVRQHIPNRAAIIAKGMLQQAEVISGMGGRDLQGRTAAVRAMQAQLKMAATAAAKNGDPSLLIGNALANAQLAVQAGRASEVLGSDYAAAAEMFQKNAQESGDQSLLDPNSASYKAAFSSFLERTIASMAMSGDAKDLEQRLENAGRGEFARKAATGTIRKATGQKYGPGTLMQLSDEEEEF